jgi:type IV secretory pathway VirJ component
VRARAAAFRDGATGVAVIDGAEPGMAGLEARIRAMVAGGDDEDALPVVELPATARHDALAIILSGDGGWRDLDRTIGEILQSQGVPTLGLDSLRYFWTRRSPEETARDLGGLIHRYTEQWGVGNVLLVGYSFGADVLPDAYLALDPDARGKVRQISLLGLSGAADWEITVTGWLGSSSSAATPTMPALKQLPPDLVQCIYGAKETDSPCPGLDGSGAEVIRTEGGHHFDGNYKALADAILAGLERRAAETPAAATAGAGQEATSK